MGGFQFMLILDLWGVSFHAVVVFGLGKNLLFKSILGRCDLTALEPSLNRSGKFIDLVSLCGLQLDCFADYQA